MHTTNPAGLALLVRGTDLPARLQAWLPDVPVACAATPAELAALLGDPRWRAVAVEVAALDGRAEELLTRLSSLFPDVPLIAIGGPADAHRLEPLVSAGCVQRFLHQPLGRKRTCTCVEAVLARPDGAVGAPTARAASLASAVPATFAFRDALSIPRRVRRTLAALAVLVAVFGLAIASGAGSSARTEAASTPAAAGTRQASGPGAGGAAQRAGEGGVARTGASVDVSPLLAAAADARARGALFEPGGDNAVHYYRQAIAAAPDDERARIALDRLGLALLSAGEEALARQRFAEAAGRAGQAALVMGDDPRVRDLHSRVRAGEEVEQQRAAERRAAWARAAREWSAPPRKALPPPQGATQLHQ